MNINLTFTSVPEKMFTDTFKFFKKKDSDLSLVVDADCSNTGVFIQRSVKEFPIPAHYGLSRPTSWNILEFRDHPGLILIRNPFTALGQRYWTVRCLRDYQKPPNRTNLSNLGLQVDDWWRELQSTDALDAHHKLRNSLRWVTLGYHHNWDTKVYSEESFNEFPEDLNSLVARVLAPALGFTDYQSQAAIVNYYPQGSTLSGHTDHSEMNLEAPLFSISLGQSAIFLIGGREKSHAATPILLRSGDVLVMTKESRLCYHAVPRILHKSEEAWKDTAIVNSEDSGDDELWISCRDEAFWRPFDTYLRDCRINLNVRQVLNKEQTRILS